MDTIVAALAGQQAELSSLLAPLDEAEWQRPSRCDGWTVADVVLHLAQTDELAIASAEGHFGEDVDGLAGGFAAADTVNDGADWMVARERGVPAGVLRDRYETGAAALRRVLVACDAHQRVTWVAGELSVRTLATTRLAETWIHTGDVSAAFDETVAPTDRLWHVARLAWRTLPYAFARAGRELAGPVAFHLRAPSGESWDFVPDGEPGTVIRGDAVELCLVAARRAEAVDTGLRAEGPDAAAVLELVRTYA